MKNGTNKTELIPNSAIQNERKLQKIKKAVSILAALFLVLWYCMIFFFSGQDGETSGSLSHEVTVTIVDGVEVISHADWSVDRKANIVSFWENPVRKMAHFSEYTIMGILLFLIWMPARTKKNGKIIGAWKWNCLVIIWVFFSAALDEWHQTMVSGRCGNIWDVLLDTSGGCFGLCICLLVSHIVRVLSKKKKHS